MIMFHLAYSVLPTTSRIGNSPIVMRHATHSFCDCVLDMLYKAFLVSIVN